MRAVEGVEDVAENDGKYGHHHSSTGRAKRSDEHEQVVELPRGRRQGSGLETDRAAKLLSVHTECPKL